MKPATDLDRNLTLATEILNMVSRRSGIRLERLLVRGRIRRPHDIIQWRWMAFWLIRTRTRLSFPDIGKLMNCDHSTVVSACQKMADRLGDIQTDWEMENTLFWLGRNPTLPLESTLILVESQEIAA